MPPEPAAANPENNQVVILAGPDESSNIVYHALASEFNIVRVIMEEAVPRSQFLKRRVKKLGIVEVAGQVLFQLVIVRKLRRASAGRIAAIEQEFGLSTAPIPEAVLTHVPSVNAPETIQLLQELNPALVVLNGTRIVSARVLDSIPARFINMHAGITPQYRGVHGAYWALARGDRAGCGVTVHLVDPGIDTGGILEQATIAPTPEDNFVTYPLLQVAAGIPLLRTAIRNLLAGRADTRPAPAGESALWYHPTLWKYLANRWRRGVR